MGDAQPPDTSSLPISPHRLIGREGERTAAGTYLLEDAVPLLTLAGPGGVGKTRLALAIAADLATHFRDGAVWVDLAPIGDPALVAATIAAALGLTLASDRPIEDELVRHLRPRQTLLLLDNCEHLLAATAALVSGLLAQCPAVQVLATSRAPLRIRWEHLLPVPPLPLPGQGDVDAESIARNEAVRLFIERARAVDPAVALTERTAPAVAALCHRLDGLPLAIELAAARSAVFPPEALLTQMRDRLHVLGGGPRDLPARQHTIEATIAWSYGLLNPEAQALFRRLAIFAGGFTIEGAEGVGSEGPEVGGRRFKAPGRSLGIGDGPEAAANLKRSSDLRPPTSDSYRRGPSVLDLLATLVEQNLVRRIEGEGEPRFTLLETIRAFGLERLDEAGERGAAQNAHAAYVITAAEGLAAFRPDRSQRLDAQLRWINLEQANIHAVLTRLTESGDADAALRLTAALRMGWHFSMTVLESRRWLEWALNNTSGTPTAARAHVLDSLAMMLWTQGEHEQAQRHAETGLAIAQELDDTELKARALDVLANIAFTMHQYERAKPLMEQAIVHWTALGWPAAYSLQVLSGIEHGLGEDEAAERHAVEALMNFREFGDTSGEAATLARLGRLVRDLGNDRAAALAYRKGLEICAAAGDRFSIVQQFTGLGEIASRRGQGEIAAALMGVIDQIAADVGARRLPTAGVNYDRATAAARKTLGEDRFTQLRTSGRKLTIDQAIALARRVAIPAASPGLPDPSWLSSLGEVDAVGEIGDFVSTVGEIDTPRLDLAALFPTPEIAPDLTYREQEVLALLCQRRTDAEIAAQLFVSPRTVASHVSNILAKLGAVNRREAAAIAARQGLLGS